MLFARIVAAVAAAGLAAAAATAVAAPAVATSSTGTGASNVLAADITAANVTTANSTAANVAASDVAASSAATSPPSLTVTVSQGSLGGARADGVDRFLGVPYAAPPTGALRWQPPQPPAPWSGVRDATSFGPHCAQAASPFGVASSSEDCLYLNIFTPAYRPAGAALPVVVWIHGGADVYGESDDYDPSTLVRDGAVVVTLNYRLGVLGFLDHPALGGGDYGLQDQQAALAWVHREIAAFGGDPRHVTLAGESAGGLSVLEQLVAPGSAGLFSAAVVESGSYAPHTDSATQAASAGEAFAASVGCADPATAALCLRAVPEDQLLAHENPNGYRPNLDPDVLPEDLLTALAAGRFHHVPVLIGTNHDERSLFVAMAALRGAPVTVPGAYPAMLSALLGVTAGEASAIAGEYPLSAYQSPADALAAAWTDASFACTGLTLEQALSAYVPTYVYEFDDENAPELYLPPTTVSYGAAHESELQYLFSLSNVAYPSALSPAQQQLSRTMTTDWAWFAWTGSPGLDWPRFGTAAAIRTLTAPVPGLETDFAADHHCGFWNPSGS